ncbi:alpha-hydroxy-acid oxidizing protein [Arthrobacter alpinus]|uniref:alpha-hydroxy-acid oxidizing protein n=1 Tax=Arthrobacter alpinus TaxID=656366 RepID=UPI001B8C1CCC|nr:alpha-hydroxy-acid oxidizing protein [Arthrobacter alpinus]
MAHAAGRRLRTHRLERPGGNPRPLERPHHTQGLRQPKDAAIAAGMGFDAIQASNHGGRQLDHMASPMDVLPEMVAAVDGRMEIIVDGGIRRGSDVIKALALGADSCAIGRPYLYGLAAAGEAGVAHVLKLFKAEMHRTMALLGVTSVAELKEGGRELIRHRRELFVPGPAESNQVAAAPEPELSLADMEPPDGHANRSPQGSRRRTFLSPAALPDSVWKFDGQRRHRGTGHRHSRHGIQ